jgi:hypothetical protein
MCRQNVGPNMPILGDCDFRLTLAAAGPCRRPDTGGIRGHRKISQKKKRFVCSQKLVTHAIMSMQTGEMARAALRSGMLRDLLSMPSTQRINLNHDNQCGTYRQKHCDALARCICLTERTCGQGDELSVLSTRRASSLNSLDARGPLMVSGFA